MISIYLVLSDERREMFEGLSDLDGAKWHGATADGVKSWVIGQ